MTMKASRVRAIIINQNSVLLIKRTKANSDYWVFPGDGVESGETSEFALFRECKEELGIDIKVQQLFSKLKSSKPETKGQTEYFYICNIIGGVLGNVNGPEYKKNSGYEGKYKIDWVEIKNLTKIDLKPLKVRNLIYDEFCSNSGVI